MDTWLSQHPDVRSIRVAACDLNGQARGKRIPTRFAGKIVEEGSRFPFSVLNLDIWGEDIEDSPLVFDSGDADGMLLPTERGYLPMPWLGTPTALLPVWMFHEDGRPFDGDPRQALARVKERYSAMGLTAVVATELEFYLIDDTGRMPRTVPSPHNGKRRTGSETLGLRALDAFDEFFTDLYDACEAMNIPADAAISEAGLGQFEINLMHVDDMLKAADDAWLFKLLVRGLARKHGFAASFMAKPYADYSGNGMHMHFSVLDENGDNIFDDGGPKGSERLQHAIAGCLNAMPGSMLILAPHANSYDRLVPGAHAPTKLCWGYENRTVAIRVPGGNPKARRIEHRVAGGDVNPYLLLSAVLGAALDGIAQKLTPPAPVTGNAYAHEAPELPATWQDALDIFQTDPAIARIFPQALIQNMAMTKRQEITEVASLSEEERIALYLEFL